jgi:hypothetical protein
MLTETSAILERPSVRALLTALLGHYDCAHILQKAPRGLPVGREIIRATAIHPRDLEELVAEGLVEAVGEAGPEEGVALTDSGAAWVQRLGLGIVPVAAQAGEVPPAVRPRWDPANRTVYYREEALLKLGKSGTRQQSVLEQFRRYDWAAAVPLPSWAGNDRRGRARLRKVLRDLEKKQRPARLHFWLDPVQGLLRWASLSE